MVQCSASHDMKTATPPADIEDFQHPIDADEFRKLGYQVIDWIADYYKGLDTQERIRPDVKPGYLRALLPPSAPEQPESFEAVMTDFQKLLMPGVVHWQAPKFFAYFSANSSYPGMLAEMLMSATNMIGFSWTSSPVGTELEMVMMDWLAELVGLPACFKFTSGGPGGGTIQGTSSEAVLVALLAARCRCLKGRPPQDVASLVVYTSDQAHSCVKKACMVAGITHVRLLPTSAETHYALQPSVLEASLAADVAAGLTPCFVCATIGTTSSCAVDPVAALAAAAHAHAAWCHVDAAYAGSAAVCPEQRELYFQGLEAVDSYSFNPHKWLLTNFDCCALWAADAAPIKEALSLTPVFLQGAGNALDYKDWQIPLGRRFRALKLFFVLRMYGADKLRGYVRHHIALADQFAARVAADPRLELAVPACFGLVCFGLKGASREQQVALLDAINARGDLFLIHTELSGQYTLRLAIGSTSTQARHVDAAWEAVSAAADLALKH
ncbi:aromatic-aminoacid decarboxylase [Haematococcus lacustris]